MRGEVQFSQKVRFAGRWYACAKRGDIWLYQRLERACSAPSIDPARWWHNLIAADAAYETLRREAARTQNMPAMLDRHRAMITVAVGPDADAGLTMPMWAVAS